MTILFYDDFATGLLNWTGQYTSGTGSLSIVSVNGVNGLQAVKMVNTDVAETHKNFTGATNRMNGACAFTLLAINMGINWNATRIMFLGAESSPKIMVAIRNQGDGLPSIMLEEGLGFTLVDSNIDLKLNEQVILELEAYLAVDGYINLYVNGVLSATKSMDLSSLIGLINRFYIGELKSAANSINSGTYFYKYGAVADNYIGSEPQQVNAQVTATATVDGAPANLPVKITWYDSITGIPFTQDKGNTPVTFEVEPNTYDLAVTYGGMERVQSFVADWNSTYTFNFPFTTVKHILSVNSNTMGVPFTLRIIGGTAMSYVTPFLGSLDEGAYEITMPASIMVGADNYNFQSWEDGAVSPKKTIQLLEDTSLYATYVPGIPPKPGFNKLWLLPIGIGAVVGMSMLGGKKKRK